MAKSHYVPKFILKNFGNNICLFNVKNGEYKENIQINKSYVENDFYSSEVEEKLNKKIESQFANLLSNKILKANGKIELNRNELLLIKKYLLISVIRSLGNDEFMLNEKKFYNKLKQQIDKLSGLKENTFTPPFIEKEIKGESSFDYWMRTLNVILDTNGTTEAILNHPDKTYPAYRWSMVISSGYLAFWDSEYNRNEFVITDIGMTSENEKGWNGITNHNHKKVNFLLSLLKCSKNDNEKMELYQIIQMTSHFHENFMMFPISSKRMIVQIAPFYKFRIHYKNLYNMPKLDELTNLLNENLFYPNDVKYVNNINDYKKVDHHSDDKYIYDIKQLTSKETIYCNMLFMDRINTWLGFSDLNKVVRSVFAYKKVNSYPYVPRVDYNELYALINDKYCSNIDNTNIAKKRT